jgi:hypothetical protein
MTEYFRDMQQVVPDKEMPRLAEIATHPEQEILAAKAAQQ